MEENIQNIINDLDGLYGVLGDVSDLFNETNMFFKNNDNPEAQNIINEINSFLGEDKFAFMENSETKLVELRINVDKVNDKLKEIDHKIELEQEKLRSYNSLEDSDEKTNLINTANEEIRKYNEEKEKLLKEKNSLEEKIEELEKLHDLIKAKFDANKKYKIDRKVADILIGSISEEEKGLISTINASVDNVIDKDVYDDLFDKYVNALNPDITYEGKAKLNGILFAYVSNARGGRDFSDSDLEKLKIEIEKYKKVEELGSKAEERSHSEEKPESENREEGRESSRETGDSGRRPSGETEIKDKRPSFVENQTFAELMASGVLPEFEEEELINICNELNITIDGKVLEHKVTREEYDRLIYNTKVREGFLKKHIKERTNNEIVEFDSLIAKFDSLIAKIEPFVPQYISQKYVDKIKHIKENLENARTRVGNQTIEFNKSVGFEENSKIKRNAKALSKAYQKYDKVEDKRSFAGRFHSWNIERLREKEVVLLSKQVKINNKNCDEFVSRVQQSFNFYNTRGNSVQVINEKVSEMINEVNRLTADNNMDRDKLLGEAFERGLSRKEVRDINKEIKSREAKIRALKGKIGKTDRNLQVTQDLEKVSERMSR